MVISQHTGDCDLIVGGEFVSAEWKTYAILAAPAVLGE
jgi:hypothetical protein